MPGKFVLANGVRTAVDEFGRFKDVMPDAFVLKL